jgi:hypothetical protein
MSLSVLRFDSSYGLLNEILISADFIGIEDTEYRNDIKPTFSRRASVSFC